MSELWDIYDTNRKKTGRVTERDTYELKSGEYHIVVAGVIMNDKNEILISQRAAHKKNGLQWECNCGSVLAGETSLEAVLRELKEELGIVFSKKEAIFLKEVRRDKVPPDFKDMWLFRRNIDLKDITFPDKEAIDAKWVTIEEFLKMYENKEIIRAIDFNMEDYKNAIKIKQVESYNYIGQNVTVKIDRPMNSKHPKYDMIYPINYGFIPNTLSGDEEELDCYVLGVDKPIERFEGKCIAVIRRTSENDDKLIVVPEGKDFTDEEIRKITNFQEKYFESDIIR